MSDHGIPLSRRGEPMRCPACNTRLVEIERSDVLIDACPECRGVWLDRGELDRILDRERRASAAVVDDDEDFFAEMEGRRDPGRTASEHDRSSHAPRKKKKKRFGVLEDLLDFDLG